MAGQRKTASIDLDYSAFKKGLNISVSRMKISSEGELLKLAYKVQNRAKDYCPVDTGRLRNSIGVLERGRDTRGTFVRVGTTVNYSNFVEYGTRHQSPQPFLRPALLEAITEWRPRGIVP